MGQIHEIAERRKEAVKKLDGLSAKLETIIKYGNEEEEEHIRHCHKIWQEAVEDFYNITDEYHKLLPEEEIVQDKDEIKHYIEIIEKLKGETQLWFIKHHPKTESISSKSSKSSVASEILKEKTVQEEIKIKSKLLEQKHKIELEQLKLKQKQDEIQIQAEYDISQMKSKNLEEFEGILPSLEKSPPKLKTFYQESQSHSNTESITHLIHQMNKPKIQIEKFSGQISDYTRFLRQFETNIAAHCSSYDEKLNYLLSFTTGEANRIVKGMSYMDSERGYKASLKEFQERYGNAELIANSKLKKVLSMNNIKSDDPKGLDDLSIALSDCYFAAESVESTHILDYQENIRQILMKLPYSLQDKFRTIAFKIKQKNKSVNFKDLCTFISEEAKKSNDPIFGKEVMNKPKKPSPPPKKSFGTSSDVNKNEKICDYCGQDHYLKFCTELVKLPLKSRYEFIKDKGYCFGCIRKNHVKSECKKRSKCHICHLTHPSILHVDKSPQSQLSPEAPAFSPHEDNHEPQSKKSGATAMGAGKQVLPILPVKVKLANSNNYIVTYAFLDNGSNTSFCTESLMEKLNIVGKRKNITIETVNGKVKKSSYEIRDIHICGLNESRTIKIDQLYTQPDLPVNTNDIITESEVNQWEHLKGIPFNVVNSEVELLIGVDVPKAMEPWDVIRTEDEGPYAVKTALGWVINGPIFSESETNMKLNFIKADNLEDMLIKSYNTDFSERLIDDVSEYSREDKHFMKTVENSLKFETGKYCMKLPFKNENISLPNNRNIAYHRLMLLKKKLMNDENLNCEYKEFMANVIDKGYAREVNENEKAESEKGHEWYLPHHGVRHKTKNKLRVIYDCSAKYQGTSLNDNLLQGPNLTNTLIGTLLRFRENEIAIVGDIESMFYQVRVDENDTNYLKFLWFKDGNVENEVVEHKMLVHLFGAKSSPSCANYALKRTAIDHRENYSDEVYDTVMRNFYVDDCLKSVDTVTKAHTLISELSSMLAEGGFRIHKWHSSSKEVLKHVPRSERSVDLDFDNEDLPVDRALGIIWNAESDQFQYKINIKDKPLTRRGMLSMLSTIYDPLGFLAPLMLHAKNILKDLCRLGLGWDDSVPDEVAKRWSLWLNDMQKLSEFSVSRCIKPSEFGEVRNATLHHFSDASQTGYGTVSYIRLENDKGKIHCSFLMGKSRVAPMKEVTIPRLELTAATVAVRVDKMLTRELDFKLDNSVFWCDSMAVLRYIKNSTSRYQTFVANRLAIIHDGSNTDQWRYVSTKLNPADIASRGIHVDEMVLQKSWITAPEFLLKPESEWPSREINLTMNTEDREIKSNMTKSHEYSNSDDIVDKLMSHFSSWYKLKRAVAWILKVRNKLLNKVKARQSNSEMSNSNETLTVNDLLNAETAILKYTQKIYYSDEMKSLGNGSNLKSKSTIRNLDPTLSDGILRVGGRLHESSLPQETKHPIIIPKNSEISKLIIRDAHEKLSHVGRNHTLAVIREKYWLINGPSAVKNVISKCITCRRSNSSVGEQKMSNLPRDRITPDEPSFTNCGVDYFGPFEVKQGRSYVKRYGVIFTCLSSRAVHIEIASSLDTDSYINAMRRFIARRGPVKLMRSDNGSNFTSAEKELKQSIEEWNLSAINSEMQQRNIDWRFNPPAGSHFGGVWERLIKSIRQVLKGILRQQILSDEVLSTLMCEVESILNSRPITRNSDNINDLEALTPNHLLLLNRKPMLPPGIFVKTDNYVKRRWRQVQYLANLFWSRWTKEYLPLLQERQKWHCAKRNLQVGDIVLVVDSSIPRNCWSMGKILKTVPDKHGIVRRVILKTATNSCLVRPIDKLCLLLEVE